MIVVYSFIGPFPEYAIDSVYQTRLFFDGPIYFILNDLSSPFVKKLMNDFKVIIIPYEEVISHDFNEISKNYNHKFIKCNDLKGREDLFIRAYERYFLLYRLMVSKKIENVLFMEVDNLLYDDPRKWEQRFSKKDLAYMYDNYYRCGAGICYIKNPMVLLQLNFFLANYILNPTNEMVHEMKSLHDYWESNRSRVQLLPTHWAAPHLLEMIYENDEEYSDTLFDVAGLGIYLGGLDPIHTNGIILKGQRAPWSFVDYTPYKYEWKTDENHRKIPHIWNDEKKKWLRINNLHIHSKALKDCLSK